MKSHQVVGLMILSTIISLIVFFMCVRIFEVITFDEMSRWFCVERNSIEYYRWFDQERIYRELVRKYPGDKKLKLEYRTIKQHLKREAECISRKTQCDRPNHFYYKSQNIRDLSNVK